MISKVKSQIKDLIKLKTKGYYILGVIKLSNGQTAYKLIEIHFKNDELFIVNRLCANVFDETLTSNLKKDYPLIVHVDGSNIINKTTENKTGYRNDLVFKGNLSDFYFYEYHQNNDIFVSVTRQQHVQDIIKELNAKGLFITHLSLGPFVMANVFKLLKNHRTIPSSEVILDINNGVLLNFKNGTLPDQEYDINGDRFNSWELPLLASFFDYRFPLPAIEFDTTLLTYNKTEYKFKQWFKVAGICSLAFFLVTLMLSHFLMDSYLSELANKKAQYTITQNTLSEINALKQKKELKEKILLTNGMNNKSFVTKYMADIGNLAPLGITLNKINIMPTTQKIKPEKKINYNINTIVLEGEASNDKIFNDWIQKLEELSWKEKISIDDYVQETSNSNVFTIKISI